MIFDIIYLARNSQNWFIKLITIIILIIKVRFAITRQDTSIKALFSKLPTFLAFALALRQRGSQFPGLGIGGGDLSGPTGG
jgi:hypothetical protein